MSKLIVLSGVPGSGKSYFSTLLRKKKGSHVYIISSDGLRDLITGSQKNISEDKLVWKMFYDLALIYAQDKKGIVVLDATNRSVEFRVNQVREIAKSFDEVDMVLFEVPREKVLLQNKVRDFPIPEDVLEEYFREFQLPQKEDYEFFNHIHIVTADNLFDIVEKY